MKKLIFLLLMAVVFACIVSAQGAAHPLGDYYPEAVLAEYGIRQDVVTQPSVLVLVIPLTVEPSSFQMVWNDVTILSIQLGAVVAEADYYLRC